MSYTFDQVWASPFTPRQVEPSCLGTSQIRLHPRESITSNTKCFSFDFPTLGEYYPNLSSVQLFVRGSVKVDGVTLEEGHVVALTNNGLHSLFSSIMVTVGENQAKITYDDYPYLALLHMTDKLQMQDQYLTSAGFTPDHGIHMSKEPKYNLNFIARKNIAAKSQSMELMGKLWCDILDIDSFLLKNTPLSIQLKKSNSKFHIDAIDPSKQYDFVIDKMYLLVDMVLPDPNLSSTIERKLTETPAKYNFEHLSLKRFNVPKDTTTHNLTRIWSGTLPRRFAFSIISEEAYTGNYALSTMNLPLTNVKSLNLKVNERDLINIDLNDHMISYHRLLQFLQVGGSSCVSYNAFKYSLGFLCVDLNTLCQNNESCITEVHPSGTLSLVIEFAKPTSNSLLCMMFAFTDATLTINSDKEADIHTVLA